MDKPSCLYTARRQVAIRLLVYLLSQSSQVASHETYVCSPSTNSQSLGCSDNEWIRVVQEVYAPRTNNTDSSTCRTDISVCNTVFYDTGLLVNCNGPVWPGGQACKEDVHVERAQNSAPCLKASPSVATMVQYTCIDGSKVLDLCRTHTVLVSTPPSQLVYLSSPQFPHSGSTREMCTCNIQGSRLKMSAVEINVRAKLPWEVNVTKNDIYDSVFAVTSGGKSLWKSSSCADCTSIHLLNSNLFLSVEDDLYSAINISYCDYGLTDQNVWLELYNSGQNLTISCSSTSLPADKIITAAQTTTTSTTTTTSIASTVASKSTTTLTTTASATSATTISTNSRASTAADTGANLGQGPSKEGESNSAVLAVTLTLLLFVLVLVIGFLGFIIYRKRHKLKSDENDGTWAVLLSFYYCIICQSNINHEDDYDSNFDAVVNHDDQSEQHVYEHVVEEDDNKVNNSGAQPANKRSHLKLAKEQILKEADTTKCREHSNQQNYREVTVMLNNLYQSHQHMLDDELEKWRRSRSSKTKNVKLSPLESDRGDNQLSEVRKSTPADSNFNACQHINPETAYGLYENLQTCGLKQNLLHGSDIRDVHGNSSKKSIQAEEIVNNDATSSTHEIEQNKPLFTPEEQRMFKALGIPTHTDTELDKNKKSETGSDSNSSSKGNAKEDCELQSKCKEMKQCRETSSTLPSVTKSSDNNIKQKSRTLPKSELVSNILEMSLKDIREKLVGDSPVSTTSNDTTASIKLEDVKDMQTTEC